MNRKIKLIHIISNLSIGGAQILVYDILKCLIEKDEFDISLITLDSGEYTERFLNSGIKVIDLKEKGLLNHNIYFKLKKILSDNKPDIVHTHLNKADFYGRIAAKKCGVPLIFSTCHNYSTTHKGADINRKSFFDLIDNYVVKFSDCHIIAISKLVKKYLVNRNSEFESITDVVYNGINTEKENYLLNQDEQQKFRKEAGLEKDDYIISVIGRLEKQKGHIFFLKSIKNLLDKHTNIKILIIGEGSLRNEIESLISVNNLSRKVILTGFKPDSEKYFEISDLIVVPSHWEGFGLVIIEAMVKGKVVIASDIGGIPEIIDDGINGFLFKCNDSNNLNTKLEYIIKNHSALDTLRRNGIKTVKDKFDIKKNTEKYYRLYLSKLKNVNFNL